MPSPLQSRLCADLGARFPIFGFTHSLDAAIAISRQYQDILVGDVLGQIDRHRVEPLMHMPAGQSVAYFDSMTTVAEVMDELVAEASAVLDRLGGG